MSLPLDLTAHTNFTTHPCPSVRWVHCRSSLFNSTSRMGLTFCLVFRVHDQVLAPLHRGPARIAGVRPAVRTSRASLSDHGDLKMVSRPSKTRHRWSRRCRPWPPAQARALHPTHPGSTRVVPALCRWCVSLRLPAGSAVETSSASSPHCALLIPGSGPLCGPLWSFSAPALAPKCHMLLKPCLAHATLLSAVAAWSLLPPGSATRSSPLTVFLSPCFPASAPL